MSWRACLIPAFLLLQGADVTLTWLLLSTRPEVVEANPVALAVMQRHGWTGAVMLKLASTSVALGCVVAIWRTRPALGRFLLAGLSAVMLGVVGYSGALLARPEDPAVVADAMSRRRGAQLDEQWKVVRELVRLRNGLCQGLVNGQIELPEAVRQMEGHLRDNLDRLTVSNRSVWPAADSPDQIALYLVIQCRSTTASAALAPLALEEVRAQLALHYPRAEQRARRSLGPLTWHAVTAAAGTE